MTDDHDDQLAPIPGATQSISGDLMERPSLPPDGQPADFPDQDAFQALAELQRAALAQPAGNVINDAPHFLRNVDGDERCGQCGEPWECPSYRQIRLRDISPLGVGAVPELMAIPPTMAEAAAAAGMDPAAFQARLEEMRRR